MRLLQPIPEEEMVAHFLRTELRSVRFRDSLERLLAGAGLDRGVVEQPDLGDAAQNAGRARLLGEWRGYGRDADVFTDMPGDVAWWRAAVGGADLGRLRYINDAYWTEFSGGSRLVREAAARILSGRMPEVAAGYLAMAGDLARGAQYPELILLHNPREDDLVVLEGHVRATAHLLHRALSEDAPAELPVLVGCSDRISK